MCREWPIRWELRSLQHSSTSRERDSISGPGHPIHIQVVGWLLFQTYSAMGLETECIYKGNSDIETKRIFNGKGHHIALSPWSVSKSTKRGRNQKSLHGIVSSEFIVRRPQNVIVFVVSSYITVYKLINRADGTG